MLLLGLDNRTHLLFDSEIDHLVPIVREDDVDKILANIMNITFHCGD